MYPMVRKTSIFLQLVGRTLLFIIVEMDETAVKEVSASNTNEAKYYSIDGKQFSQPQKGLTILKMSDGTTRKVVK